MGSKVVSVTMLNITILEYALVVLDRWQGIGVRYAREKLSRRRNLRVICINGRNLVWYIRVRSTTSVVWFGIARLAL